MTSATPSAQGRRNRAWGAQAERVVAAYLRSGWPNVRRFFAGDGRQPGDLDGIPNVCLEVKARRDFNPTAWVRQAQAARRPDQDWAICVVKPDGVAMHDVGNWLFVMSPRDGFNMLHRLQKLEGRI